MGLSEPMYSVCNSSEIKRKLAYCKKTEEPEIEISNKSDVVRNGRKLKDTGG